MSDEFLLASATRLAARIRSGEVTSRAVVAAHVARARAVHPHLRAVAADRFDAALAEADAADRLTAVTAPEALPPLHGVPCSVKECIAVAGMPQTAGLVARKGRRASADAFTVARLRAAGAIPLGVTNTSELCMWWETDNRVYGRTHNPYDPSRTVGGSSGGEGALVGSGASPIGLGADIGGSIRMPAFFCGIFGHKPTGGLVSLDGHFPEAHGSARRYCTLGPMTRRAEDLMPMLRILAGHDGVDPWMLEAEMAAQALGDPAAVDLAGLTVLDVPDDGARPPTEALRAAQVRCADHLRGLGATVRTARVPDFRHAFELWGALVDAAGGPSYASLLGEGKAVAMWLEWLRFAMGRSPHTLPSLALAAVEVLPKWLPARAKRLLALGAELRTTLDALLGPTTVLLYPSHRRSAPRHGQPLLSPFDFAYTGLWNVLELPATQVPLGLGQDGLPLGIQVVGARGRDPVTIAVAMALERAFGGWVMPAR